MVLKLQCLIYYGVVLVIYDDHDKVALLMFIATMDLLEKDFSELKVSLRAMSIYLLYSIVIRA